VPLSPYFVSRRIFVVFGCKPVSAGREGLRAHLAGALPSSALSIAEIKSVIADYDRIPDDRTIGRLFGLRVKFEGEPRPELFDEPTDTWLPKDTQRRHAIEVDDLLDYGLAASISATANLTAARLWRWTVNVRDHVMSNLGAATAKAVTAWLDGPRGRDVELLDVILAEDDLAKGPWVFGNIYYIASGRRPSAALVRHVLTKAAAAPAKAAATRLLQIAVEMVRIPGADTDAYWETYACVAGHANSEPLLEHLTTSEIEQ
jgi:hypothetical protein